MEDDAVVQTGESAGSAREWCDLTVKIVVLGARGVGKTTLVASLLSRHGFHADAAPGAAVRHGPIPASMDAVGDAKTGADGAVALADLGDGAHAAADLEATRAEMTGGEHTAVMRVGKQWVRMEVVDATGDMCSMANFHTVLPGQSESGASLALAGDVFVVCYDPSDGDTLVAAEGIMKMVAAQKDPLPMRAVLCATKCDARVALPGSAQGTAVARGKRIARDLGVTHAMTTAEDNGRGVDECFSLAVRQALLSLEVEQSWCICC